MWKHVYLWLVGRSFWQSYWRIVLVSYPIWLVAFAFYLFVPDKMGYRHQDPIYVYPLIVLFATLLAAFRAAYGFKNEREKRFS
jgi:hypothetical protein